MTWLIALLSPRVLAGLGLALAIAAGLWYVDHRARSQQAAIDLGVLNAERLGWQTERTNAATATQQLESQYRAKETKDRERLTEVQANGTIVANAIAADSERTGRTVAGLRTALDIAAHTLSAQATGTTTAAADCSSAIAAVRVRSDMLAGLAERGAAVAGFADKAFNAAFACVSADAVTR